MMLNIANREVQLKHFNNVIYINDIVGSYIKSVFEQDSKEISPINYKSKEIELAKKENSDLKQEFLQNYYLQQKHIG